MKAGYKVEHRYKTDCLGEHHRLAVMLNYHELNEVGITYWSRYDLSPDQCKVAIFRLKPKHHDTNRTTKIPD